MALGVSRRQPEASRRLSSVSIKVTSLGLAPKSYGVPLWSFNASMTLACAVAPNFQPASFSSILARAKRSSSAFLLASAALFSAIAARSVVAARLLLRYSSLTLPIHTTPIVATTPRVKATIKARLAQSYSLAAHGSDSHTCGILDDIDH